MNNKVKKEVEPPSTELRIDDFALSITRSLTHFKSKLLGTAIQSTMGNAAVRTKIDIEQIETPHGLMNHFH